MKERIRTERLKNGLSVDFFDCSNRYFGDYHRLCIEVCCRVPLNLEAFAGSADPAADLQEARAVLGGEVVLVRRLEKMGVAGETLEQAREALIDNFIRSSLPYLEAPIFPRRFIATELGRRQGSRPPWPRP